MTSLILNTTMNGNRPIRRDLTEHRPFRCKLCNKTFKYKYDMCRHTRTHYGIKPHGCTECKKTFSSRSDLNRHKRTHTGYRPFKCLVQDCNKTFLQRTDLSRHIRTHTGDKPYVCMKCPNPKGFCQKSDLDRHNRLHSGERPFQCLDCGRNYSQKSDLVRHSRSHVTMPAATPTTENNTMETDTTPSASSLTLPTTGVIAQRVLITTNKLVGTPVVQQAQTFLDPYTGRLYALSVIPPNGQLISLHQNEGAKSKESGTLVNDDKNEMKSGQKPTVSSEDPRESQRQNIIKEQLRQRQIQERQEQLKEKRPPERITQQKEKLEDQQLENSAEILRINQQLRLLQGMPNQDRQPSTKPGGTEMIDRMAALIQRAVSTSTDSIALPPSLIEEGDNVSAAEGQASETICTPSSTSFTTAEPLPTTETDAVEPDTAMSVQTTPLDPLPVVIPSPHKCVRCAKSFAQKSDLHRHFKIHTGEKPFKCTLCPKAFYQRSDLSRHLRTHTGDRPFKCGLCDKAFAQKSDLHRHERRVHDNVSTMTQRNAE